MSSLAFKHFRRFENFPKTEFGDITFLVGKNNSGKSTFAKALVLVEQFLKSSDWGTFRFNNEHSENVNFITYTRALNSNIDHKVHGNFIDFTYRIGNYEFYLKITGTQNNTVADVLEISFKDLTEEFVFTFKPQSKYFSIQNCSKFFLNQNINVTTIDKIKVFEKINEIEGQINELSSALNQIEDKLTIAYIDNLEKKKKLEENLAQIKEASNLNKIDLNRRNEEFSLECSTTEQNPTLVFEEVLQTFFSKYDINFKQSQSKVLRGEKLKEFANLRYLYQNKRYFEFTFDKILEILSGKEFIYFPAIAVKQYALLPSRDKSNQLAQAVFEYANTILHSSTECEHFIAKWLQFFSIGDRIEVIVLEGDYCLAEIVVENIVTNKKNSIKSETKNILFADLGMGSQQIVKLILQLAVLIFKPNRNNKISTVIIEEPEMNLHPKLQSDLCDLFFEVSTFGIQLIIETHSEYLIRKTQLLVKNFNLAINSKSNPFHVIYFNDDGNIWNMEYREDGKFKNEFGTGFFDESTNLAFEIL